MPRSKMPFRIIRYQPHARRSLGRPYKLWHENVIANGPKTWKDDDDYDDLTKMTAVTYYELEEAQTDGQTILLGCH
jgi:hypothetical protein